MNHNRKIVILEDDVFYGKMIKNYLLNQDFKNIELYHDEDDCLNAMNSEPALVIIDHHLKHSIGMDIMAQIKEKNANVQFIYLSGQEYSNVAIKALRAGAVDYIEKNNEAFDQLKKSIDQFVH